MDKHFPFSESAYKKLGRNTQGNIKEIECEITKRAHLAGLPKGVEIPLLCMWIVNELKAEINLFRKINNLNPNEKVIIKISKLITLQRLSVKLEWKYLYEECMLQELVLGSQFAKAPNSFLVTGETAPVTLRPIRLTLLKTKGKPHHKLKA